MHLYLIEWRGAVDYDEHDAMVIRAENAGKARKLAMYPWGYGYGSNRQDFTDPNKARISRLASNVNGKAGIVLASFNAG